MLRIIVGFFAFVGMITCVLLSLSVYVWTRDLYHIRSIIEQVREVVPIIREAAATYEVRTSEDTPLATTTVTTSSATTPAIDTTSPQDTPPLKFTPSQVECFTRLFGASRVAEIVAGSAPTTLEIATGLSCL